MRAYLASVAVEYVPDMTVYHHHGRRSETEGKRLMRGYMVGTGGLCAKYLFKNPSLCRRDRSEAGRRMLRRTRTSGRPSICRRRTSCFIAVWGQPTYVFVRVRDMVSNRPDRRGETAGLILCSGAAE